VSGANLDELHLFVTDLELELPLESPGRRHRWVVAEIEVLKKRHGKGAGVEQERDSIDANRVEDPPQGASSPTERTQNARGAQEGRVLRSRRLHEVLHAARGSDDFGAVDLGIAVAVVPVAVGVHQGPDIFGGSGGVAHRHQHVPGECSVEEGVDEQRL
jgi:hypothetical protein